MIGIAGYIRVPASARDLLQPQIATYVPSCRSEAGCDAFELCMTRSMLRSCACLRSGRTKEV
jgi:hypothetical protein